MFLLFHLLVFKASQLFLMNAADRAEQIATRNYVYCTINCINSMCCNVFDRWLKPSMTNFFFFQLFSPLFCFILLLREFGYHIYRWLTTQAGMGHSKYLAVIQTMCVCVCVYVCEAARESTDAALQEWAGVSHQHQLILRFYTQSKNSMLRKWFCLLCVSKRKYLE